MRGLNTLLTRTFALARREHDPPCRTARDDNANTPTIDPSNIPPLTARQKAEIKAAAALPDSAIDYGDIPPLADEFWKNAAHNPFYKPTKMVTTVRVDVDVLTWLKSQGKGYQTRLNAILRAAMLREIKH